jgi:phosphatidylserine synthase
MWNLTLHLSGETVVCYIYIFKSALRFEAQKVMLSEKKAAFMKGRPFPFGFVMASVLRTDAYFTDI